MNFSIVSCVAYFIIFYIYLNAGISAVQPASKFYSSYVNSSLVYVRLMQTFFALVVLFQLMNGYIKVQKFNLSFLIQMCYLAGDHLFKNLQLLLKAI